MADTYKTISGDTWDAIAFRVYGSENYAGWLMEHNLPQVGQFVFEAGVVLQTPEVPKAAYSGLPAWRQA